MTEIVVRTEATPNPQTMRYSVEGLSLSTEPVEFKSLQETTLSPLAKKIFGFPWTAGVFIGRDFLTVTKQDWVEWETLAEPLADIIQEHLSRGEPVVLKPKTTEPEASDDNPTVKEIKRILDHEIRPAVALDGGDIIFSHYAENIVYVHMQGSCNGCPSSTMTLKEGIESRLRQAIPEIQEVVAV